MPIESITVPARQCQYDDCDGPTLWEPWTNGYAIGFRVTRVSTGEVRFVYLNPSTDGETPDAFVYVGAAGDPVRDSAVIFVAV